MKNYFYIVIFLISINSNYTYANDDSFKIVAKVYNYSILNQDVYDRMRILQIMQPQVYERFFKNDESFFYKEMLDLVINEIILEEESQKMRMFVDDGRVFETIFKNDRFNNKDDLIEFLSENEINYDTWIRYIRFNITINQLIKNYFIREIYISDDEVYNDDELYEILEIENVQNLNNLSCNNVKNYKIKNKDSVLFSEMSDNFKAKIRKKDEFDKNNSILICKVSLDEESFRKIQFNILNRKIAAMTENFFQNFRNENAFFYYN